MPVNGFCSEVGLPFFCDLGLSMDAEGYVAQRLKCLCEIMLVYDQAVKRKKTILLGLGVFIFIIGLLYYIHAETGIPFKLLTKDTGQSLEYVERIGQVSFSLSMLPFVGFMSTLGIMIWSGAFCLLAVQAVKIFLSEGWNQVALYLASSAIWAGLMAFDDAFMLHDFIIPGLFDVPENLVLLFYIIITCLYLIHFVVQIMDTGYIFMMLAFVFFGLSILLDVFGSTYRINVAEDLAKLLGIVFWFIYCLDMVICQAQDP